MQLPETGFLRLPQIIGDPKAVPPIPAIIPVSKTSWWQGVKDGRYPPKADMGGFRIAAWRVEDIRALIEGTWSQDADSYRQDDARAAWRSFRMDGKVQAGTLFHMAIQAGWEPQGGKIPDLPAPAPRKDLEKERCAVFIRQRQAAQKAFNIWKSAPPARKHPYLTAKRIKPHGARLFRGALLVPMYDGPGRLVNLQFIQEDGTKRFLSGGRKSGCYWWIGETVTESLCMAEGYATAASIHESTGYRCYIAFDAGNLPHVGEAIRAQFPGARIVICADNDAAGIKGAQKTLKQRLEQKRVSREAEAKRQAEVAEPKAAPKPQPKPAQVSTAKVSSKPTVQVKQTRWPVTATEAPASEDTPRLGVLNKPKITLKRKG